MSYGVAQALQAAVFAAVSGDPVVQSLVGGDVFYAWAGGVLPVTYVLLGDENVTALGDSTGEGARHDLLLSVISDAAGFALAKDLAAAISDVLVDANLTLSRGNLTSLSFLKAKARRGTGVNSRRIDMWFRARTDDF